MKKNILKHQLKGTTAFMLSAMLAGTTFAAGIPVMAAETELESESETETLSYGEEKYQEGMAAFREGDEETATACFLEGAEAGNVDAMEMLADAYLNGKGTEKDIDEAIKWLELAIEEGNARSCTYLGQMYMDGIGYDQDYEKALEWFDEATERGDFKGARYAGQIYENGYGDVEVDLEKAAEYYTIAADSGDTTAKFYLGSMYEEGAGVEQDYEKAVECYSALVDDYLETNHVVPGVADSLAALANLYEQGLGVEQDVEQALELYEQAVEAGNEDAQEAVDRLQAEE